MEDARSWAFNMPTSRSAFIKLPAERGTGFLTYVLAFIVFSDPVAPSAYASLTKVNTWNLGRWFNENVKNRENGNDYNYCPKKMVRFAFHIVNVILIAPKTKPALVLSKAMCITKYYYSYEFHIFVWNDKVECVE